MATLGETETLAAFLVEARLQSREAWDTDYAAETVIAYIKAGFEVR